MEVGVGIARRKAKMRQASWQVQEPTRVTLTLLAVTFPQPFPFQLAFFSVRYFLVQPLWCFNAQAAMNISLEEDPTFNTSRSPLIHPINVSVIASIISYIDPYAETHPVAKGPHRLARLTQMS